MRNESGMIVLPWIRLSTFLYSLYYNVILKLVEVFYAVANQLLYISVLLYMYN